MRPGTTETLLVRQIRVGPMANFVYVVVDQETREAAVIDSGWDTRPIEREIKDLRAKVKVVVATHGHFDHVSSVTELAEKIGSTVAAHERSSVDCETRLKDGDVIRIGHIGLRVLYTPGHTEDSICLNGQREVFTGDTLFIGTIGRFDPRSAREMYKSLHEVIMALPRETIVFPGHDYGEARTRTLGEEATLNPFLVARDFSAFSLLFS